MISLTIILVISLVGFIASRSMSSSSATRMSVMLEIFSSSSLSISLAAAIYMLYRNFVTGQFFLLNWLIWMIMFVVIVVVLRILGTRLEKFKQANIDMDGLTSNLEYHSSVFWKLISAIALFSSILSETSLNRTSLLTLGFVITLFITIQGAMKFYKVNKD